MLGVGPQETPRAALDEEVIARGLTPFGAWRSCDEARDLMWIAAATEKVAPAPSRWIETNVREATISPAGRALRSPGGPDLERFGLYELRTVALIPNGREAFIRIARDRLLTIHAASGLHPVGVWWPEDNPDSVIILRAFCDPEDRASTLARVYTHPEFGTVSAQLQALEIGVAHRFYELMSGSPPGR